jgi:hypothetical protein
MFTYSTGKLPPNLSPWNAIAKSTGEAIVLVRLRVGKSETEPACEMALANVRFAGYTSN